MKNKITHKGSEGKQFFRTALFLIPVLAILFCLTPALAGRAEKPAALEQRIASHAMNQGYKDDGH